MRPITTPVLTLVLASLVTLAGCTTPDAAVDRAATDTDKGAPLTEPVELFTLNENVGGENQLDVNEELLVPAGARIAVIEYDYDVRTDSSLCGDGVSLGVSGVTPALRFTLSATGDVGSTSKNVESNGCSRADNADTHALAGPGGTIDLRVVTENARGPVTVRVLALPAS